MAKQHYCFLKKFNNYFNRKIIKYSSQEDYESNSDEAFIPTDEQGRMTPFDFNPNDNVTTEIIANGVPFEPDYFLLLDEDENIVSRWFVIEQKRNRQGQWLYQLKRDVIADNLNNLLNAPIFVQKGMLGEDDPFIVNDEGMSLNQIKQDELFITDRSKTAWIVGYMAKNAGGADINIQVDNETIVVNYKTLADIATAVGTTEGVLNSILNFGDDTSNKAYFTSSITIRTYLAMIGEGVSADVPFEYNFAPDFSSGSGSMKTTTSGSYDYLFITTLGQTANNMTEPFRQAVIDKRALWSSQVGTMLGKSYYLTEAQLNILRTFNGNYVKYNGQYYKLSINDVGTNNTTVRSIRKDGTYSCLEQTCAKTVELVGSSITPFSTGTYNPLYEHAYKLDTLRANEKEVVVSLKFLSPSDFIPQLNTVVSSGRKTTGDQEYDIFAIPLSIEVDNNGNNFDTEESYVRRIASAIAREENAKVYDLQLLPYCPVQELLDSSNTNKIVIDNLTEHTDFDFITKNIYETYNTITGSSMTFTPSGVGTWTGTATRALSVPAGKTATVTDVSIQIPSTFGTISDISYSMAGNTITITFTFTGEDPTDPSVYYWLSAYIYFYYDETTNCGIMFYVPFSTFEANISKYDLNPYWGDKFSNYSKKIVSNCSMCRLVSPNYQGAFEFNVAKNGGSVESFNIFCTYKPYTPVIKVAPNFNWLYSSEFKDNRGLICGGDFSLPRITDEWRSYELNNKNYQNIFNRDIQHLDFVQNIEMRNQLVSGAVGIFSDAVKGGVAGGIATASPYGAIAGAVIGGGASAVGYGIDVDTMARVHRENKQLAIDKFNYQLGNIKALPYTLTKVGSFDVISKIFPFVETYWCSDEELEAFEKKIEYESMTIMRIGKLQEFISQDSELHYFKGALIRNDEIADDAHILNAIYEELLKGVYI